MVNYVCAFSQSESGKYFEWIIMCSEDKSGFYIIVWITSVVPNFLGQLEQSR